MAELHQLLTVLTLSLRRHRFNLLWTCYRLQLFVAPHAYLTVYFLRDTSVKNYQTWFTCDKVIVSKDDNFLGHSVVASVVMEFYTGYNEVASKIRRSAT